jgi:hypothetical protein
MILEDVNDRQGTKAPSKWPFLCIPLPQVEQPWDVLPSSRANETAFEWPPESSVKARQWRLELLPVGSAKIS